MNPNPFAWPFRAQYAFGGVACIALLAYAFYEQFQMGVEPCPLCIFQRLAFIAMALVFLVAAAHGPRAGGRRVYAVLVVLAAAIGAGIAGYHLWVQHIGPDPTAGCTPGWNYWVENFSYRQAWVKTLQNAFTGHADCADVNWSFLGLSMPAWTLAWYVGLGAGALWAGFRKR